MVVGVGGITPIKMGLSLGLLVFYVTFNDISVIFGAEKYAGMQNALFSKSKEGVTFPLSLRNHFRPRLEKNYGALQY